MSETTIHLETTGHMACLAQIPVAAVKTIIGEIGAKPRFTINGLEHYDAKVCGTVIARARGWTDQAAYYRRFDEEIQGND
ncbi:MAG: hypothetical protein GX594_13360 [Pirellulaceae bacterium]|nr:hypothetical protein [Pirellulaceae bacterium]